MYLKERNPKAKIRFLAILKRKEDMSLRDISKDLKQPLTNVARWLRQVKKGGLDRIYDIKQTGKPPRLNKSQKLKLKEILSQSPQKQNIPFIIWTTKLVQYIIYDLFKVLYKIRNIEYLVKSLGFTFQKPRQKHKLANQKAQEKFKKNFKKMFGSTLNVDSRCFALMKHTSQ